MSGARFLLVEDDDMLSASITRALTQLGGIVVALTNTDDARRMLTMEGPYVAILVELRLAGPVADPLLLLRDARDLHPRARRILMSGAQSGAVGALVARAMKDGVADDFLAKPFGWPLLERIVARPIPTSTGPGEGGG